MSVNAVHMFYGKLASDMMMRKAFAQATSAAAIKFAAERGYMFTEYDLQVSGETMQGHAKRLGDELKQLQQHQQRLGVAGKAAAQAVAKEVKSAGKAAGQTPSQVASEMSRIMASMETQALINRVTEIIGGLGSAKKSGGG